VSFRCCDFERICSGDRADVSMLNAASFLYADWCIEPRSSVMSAGAWVVSTLTERAGANRDFWGVDDFFWVLSMYCDWFLFLISLYLRCLLPWGLRGIVLAAEYMCGLVGSGLVMTFRLQSSSSIWRWFHRGRSLSKWTVLSGRLCCMWRRRWGVCMGRFRFRARGWVIVCLLCVSGVYDVGVVWGVWLERGVLVVDGRRIRGLLFCVWYCVFCVYYVAFFWGVGLDGDVVESVIVLFCIAVLVLSMMYSAPGDLDFGGAYLVWKRRSARIRVAHIWLFCFISIIRVLYWVSSVIVDSNRICRGAWRRIWLWHFRTSPCATFSIKFVPIISAYILGNIIWIFVYSYVFLYIDPCIFCHKLLYCLTWGVRNYCCLLGVSFMYWCPKYFCIIYCNSGGY